MAQEITLSATLAVKKGNVDVQRSVSSTRFDQAGDHLTWNVQDIGTAAHEALTIGADLATAGYAWFRNLDATNYVEIGVDAAGTFHPLLRLKAGQVAVAPLTTTAVYAKANTASVKLEYWVNEA